MSDDDQKTNSEENEKDHSLEFATQKQLSIPKEEFEKLPEPLKNAILATRNVVALSHYQGPIPSKEEIAGWEKVLPGSADRILRMSENEQEHRHKIETKHLATASLLVTIDSLFLLPVGIALSILSFILILFGKDWIMGGIFGSTGLGALWTHYLQFRSRKKNRENW